jgi:hypothetical protein
MTQIPSATEVEHMIKRVVRRWFTLGIPVRMPATLDEQLAAIRQLGASRSPIALDYVRRLNEVRTEQLNAPGAASESGTWESNPHAKGDLSRALQRAIPHWYGEDQIQQQPSIEKRKQRSSNLFDNSTKRWVQTNDT